ncbi:hypothetical protein Pedsa_1804 [Pseudopedobacter saltans DSM 12145]|uniref:Carbohydrate-binding domain-containing protein n=1 Tax=Pseudopedobacter saltans (strain ATCC 51119 / DSM 12145 / JCM 21818 / CCUG 39354 / LMG 10337 / NBRC 100064 / NCIMB 13643) TaxID=762903 RepID=F0S897_PSESL|nr:carbohydrate-binding family 9-like protein [Pseudopedobacter saltans]ADY52359.1 hypothetical protein Pedsa_1804 [Pseudopedobacter saltans DSM 12145]
MNTIAIHYNSLVNTSNSPEDIHLLLDSAEKHSINQSAWPNKNYLGNCDFSILYGDNALAIKYFVSEDEIRAVYSNINDPVYKDSCVEFFVSLDNENYYNFEFNCNGTCLAQYGPDKANRTFLSPVDIQSIKTNRSVKLVKANQSDLVHWELTVIIPFHVFSNDNIDSLKGELLGMNFYKCGDDLIHPHYLSWNKVNTPAPNFHRPDFFGQGIFK